VGPLTQWRGQSDTTLGRFGWGFLMSLLLHAPLTPLAALFGLLTLLTATEPPPEALPPLTGIPVDLIEGEEAEAPPPETTPPPAPEPAVALQPPEEKAPNEPKLRDAGVADAEASDAAPDAEDAGTEGDDAGIVDGGISDPVAASGAERITDVNANVKIMIYTEKIRTHPLAPRVGRLLASVPQWRDFFGPAALDPIRDIDRMQITGPQLRDSSEVAVVVRVNVSEERVRTAIDAIVRSDPDYGNWLDGGVPTATARVDRAQRFFVMPSPKMVIVTPASALENARKVGPRFTLRPSKGSEVALGEIVTPWRPFRASGIPFDVPKSIQKVRAKLTFDEYGGAIVELIAKDENAEKAAENAEFLQRNVSAAGQLNLGLLGAILGTGNQKFFEKVLFSSKGDEIHGHILFTRRQLDTIIDFAPMVIGGSSRQRPPRRSTDGGTPLPERNKPGKTPPETIAPPAPSRQPPSAEPPATSPTLE
jgi:hypothetical protein